MNKNGCNMKILFPLLFFLFSINSNAVVKRHDLPPGNYVVKKAPEYLIDMPHEGYGVLINSQWIVTVAHTIFYDYVGKDLTVGSRIYEIESVHVHPNYTEPNKNLFEEDLAPLMRLFKSRSDAVAILHIDCIYYGAPWYRFLVRVRRWLCLLSAEVFNLH
jgi:hypothetical protein